MINSKLLQLFQFLSAEDLRQIQKMLKSPFFTSNANLQTLFDILRKQHPTFTEKAVQKEKVFARIFPKHSYKEMKLRNLMTDLVKIIEKHLVLNQLEKKTLLHSKLLTESFLEKREAALAEAVLSQVQKKMQSVSCLDEDFYLFQYYFLQAKKKMIQLVDPKKAAGLIKESRNSLHGFYHLSDIKLVTELKSVTGFLPIQDVENDTGDLQDNINYQLYKEVALLIENNDLDLYFKIKERLFQNLDRISLDTRIDTFCLLMNFVINEMDADDGKFNTLAFQLYQSGIQHQILLQKPGLIESHFYNIVVISAKEKEFDWASDFIKSHQKYLREQTEIELGTISEACLSFHQGEFSNTIDLLVAHSFKIGSFENIARTLLVKSYYELFIQDNSYFDLLIAQTHGFEKFTRRNKEMSTYRKETQIHFVQFVRKLALARRIGNFTTKEKGNLQEKLSKNKTITSRSWLMEKLKD